MSSPWPYYPALLARPVPRYTSYPTAAAFTPAVGRDAQRALLARLGAQSAYSLYVHIPYCHQICWYCGCHTGAANRGQRLQSYLDALAQEIRLTAAALTGGEQATGVRRIAFGGGSPNAVRAVDFVRLVDQLTTAFGITDPDISIEIDPRGFDEWWAAMLSATGVARASLGVQTLAPHIQSAIGRVQPPSLIAQVTDQLRAAGVSSLNYDLMYGLPGQGRGDLAHTLEQVIRLRPDRIALFGYAHVPHLMPRQRRIDATALPDQAERFAMAGLGYDMLTAAGYQPVGFDHFALPEDPLAVASRAGTMRRNFQGFTDDAAPAVIGLGASAISMSDALLVQNEKNSGRYRMQLSAGQLTGAVGVARTGQDRAVAAVISDLLCFNRADLAPLGGMARWAPVLADLMHFELCTAVGDRLILAPDALPYARSIAARFDPGLADAPRRFSSAV